MDENQVTYTEDRIPVFLSKMWTILENPENSGVVCWDDSGFSFHILDQFQFSKNVLPRYFKHSNLNSLVRQLNMYGFRKMTPLERSGVTGRNYEDQLEFSHPYFIRGKPEYLRFIKRKSSGKQKEQAPPEEVVNKGSTSGSAMVKVPARDLSAVLQEVRQLRDKQNKMNERMSILNEQNETLWTEVATIRKKHQKQEQIVNKLVQFLVALVNPSNPGKRLAKRPLLAIEETTPPKQRRTSSMGPSSSSSSMDSSSITDILERLQKECPMSPSSPPWPSSSRQGNNNQYGFYRSNFPQVAIPEELQNTCQDFGPAVEEIPVTSVNCVNPQVVNPVRTRPPSAVVNQMPPQMPSAAQYQAPAQYQQQQPQQFTEVIVPQEIRQGLPAQDNNGLVTYTNGDPNLSNLADIDDLNEYLTGIDRQIDNCRDQIGNTWNSLDYDYDFDGNNQFEPIDRHNRLMMLEGPHSEEPGTPQLLTPTGGSPANDHMLGLEL
ncbi:hypothetical protein L596_028992 [Steinernema carpocapsae]|uniref:HSF-type DNA-binding domain-containing protein n=1 Tax=Steinernema carpocapsae TaxID=34508 RepID=A0A4U5LTB1_STECR|nr:hypothetical protein L596_028992 [Steinernema carpocapsae]